MKKTIILLLIMVFVLVGCSSNDTNNQSNNNNLNTEQESDSVDVDKNLFNVEITIPASMFEGENIDEVIEEENKEGLKEVTKNDDGSVTYKMTKSYYKEMIAEIKEDMISSVEEIKNDSEYPSINDISYNDSFSEFVLVVNKEGYENSFESFVELSLGFEGLYYQLFNGVSEEDLEVTIIVKNADTEEVIRTSVYPDDWDSQE